MYFEAKSAADHVIVNVFCPVLPWAFLFICRSVGAAGKGAGGLSNEVANLVIPTLENNLSVSVFLIATTFIATKVLMLSCVASLSLLEENTIAR